MNAYAPEPSYSPEPIPAFISRWFSGSEMSYARMRKVVVLNMTTHYAIIRIPGRTVREGIVSMGYRTPTQTILIKKGSSRTYVHNYAEKPVTYEGRVSKEQLLKLDEEMVRREDILSRSLAAEAQAAANNEAAVQIIDGDAALTPVPTPAVVKAAQPAPIEVPGVDPIPMEKIGAAEMAKVGALALKLKAIFTTEEILVLSEALTQYTDNAEEVAEDDATVAANRETAIGILDAVDSLIAEPV